MKPAILYKTTGGEYMTLSEYENKNCEGEEHTVYYASDAKRQAQMIQMYNDQGKDVVLLDTLIDANFISFLEYGSGEEKLSFKRIDSAAEGLTDEGETDEDARKALEERFRVAMGDNEVEEIGRAHV